MSPVQIDAFRAEVAAVVQRAEAAESRAVRAERERDQARALLTRIGTRLCERTDENPPLRAA